MRKFAIGIIAVVLVVVVTVIIGTQLVQKGSQGAKNPDSSHGVDMAASTDAGPQSAPDAVLRNVVTKSPINLKDFIKGKAVLINFWASWCEACMEEMPSIVKLNDTFKDEGFALLSVNIDENPEKTVSQLISDLRINFPVYNDTEEQLVKAFNVVALPFNVLVDRNQKIVRSESGARDWASDTIIKEFRLLLKNP